MANRSIRGALVAALSLVLVNPAAAVTPPTPSSVLEQSRQSREERERLRELQQRRQPAVEVIDNRLPASASAAQGGGRSFLLREVRLDESEILDQTALDELKSRYVGREVRIGELFELVAGINDLYRSAGALTAKAVLPAQKIRDGIVTIRLVEGRVGGLAISGNQSTQTAFIEDRLGVAAGDLVLLGSLEEQLLYFNAVNDIDLRAVLKPGEAFGTTDIEIQVLEPNRREAYVFADNAGSDDVGLYRLGFAYTDRSLSGRRDVLLLGGYAAEGTEAVNAAYSFPLGVRGARLGLSGDYSRIEIVDGPLEPLHVDGDSWNLGVALTHPLWLDSGSIVNGFVAVNVKESSTDFDGVTLFETDVRTLSVGADWRADATNRSSYARAQLTTSREGWGSDESFNRVHVDFSQIRLLAGGRSLLLRARGQWSDKELLPSSEQFQVGGMSSVRGYPEGLLSGDKGYLLSVELSVPFPSQGDGAGSDPISDRLRGLVFLDHGAAFPFKGDGESIDSQDFLTSVGAGVSMNFDPGIEGRLVLGLPIGGRDDDEDHPTLHFYLQKTFL